MQSPGISSHFSTMFWDNIADDISSILGIPNIYSQLFSQPKITESQKWCQTFFTIKKEMFNKMNNSYDSITFRRQFEAAPNDARRVALCLEDCNFKYFSGKIMDRYHSFIKDTGFGGKWSSNASKHFYAAGEYYLAKEYLKAIGKCSYSIANSPTVGCPIERSDQKSFEELPFGYNHRSVVYFDMQQYQFALEDINTALALGYANYKPLVDILVRKWGCLIRLGRLDEAKTVLEELRTMKEVSEDSLQKLDQLIKKSKAKPEAKSAQISSTNNQFGSRYKAQEKFPELSERVAIEASKSSPNGRRLVAVEEIQFGDILTQPLPYSSVLIPKLDLDYCHHCCRDLFGDPKNLTRPIHCPKCSMVLYCTEKCRDTAWNTYHRYECGYHAILQLFSSEDRLALRLFLMHQPKEILDVQSGVHSTLQFPVDYSHIYQLKTGTDEPETDESETDEFETDESETDESETDESETDETPEESLRKTINVCIFILFLKETEYFASAPNWCSEAWAGSVLLRHMRQMACNSKMVTIADTEDLHHIEICPTFAFSNHCCVPNARLEKLSNRSDCIVAMRSIAPGEEVTISVNGVTAEEILSLKERQAEFKKRSGEECTCARCILERKDMPSEAKCYYALACEACDGLIEKDADSESFQCPDCYLEISPGECQRRHAKADQLKADLASQVLIVKATGKVDQIRTETIYFQAKTLLHPSSYQLVTMAAQVADMYFKIALLQKAADYAEEHLRLVGTCYGEVSLKMMQVLEDYGQKIKQVEKNLDKTAEKAQKGQKAQKKGQMEAIEKRFKAIIERKEMVKLMYS